MAEFARAIALSFNRLLVLGCEIGLKPVISITSSTGMSIFDFLGKFFILISGVFRFNFFLDLLVNVSIALSWLFFCISRLFYWCLYKAQRIG